MDMEQKKHSFLATFLFIATIGYAGSIIGIPIAIGTFIWYRILRNKGFIPHFTINWVLISILLGNPLMPWIIASSIGLTFTSILGI